MPYNLVPLTPKISNGPLKVVSLGRLSREKATKEATQLTLDSSLATARRQLGHIYSGPLVLKELAEQASGLIAERATIQEAKRLIATGEWDLVIAEDSSRIFREPQFLYEFFNFVKQHDTRLICFGDGLDSADEHSEVALGAAALRHGLYIPDMRRRLKRTLLHSFLEGGNVQKVKYGYVKLNPKDARSGKFGPPGLGLAKDTAATPHFKKMREILVATKSYAPVLDWLAENEILVGPHASSGGWSQQLLKDLLTDPILIGVRRYGVRQFTRVNGNAQYCRKLNPKGPEQKRYPELAHFTDEEFATLQETIQQICQANGGGADDIRHPRLGVPRNRSIFPRQHAVCSICGGLMYAYDRDQIKCENAHKRGKDRCWSHVQVSGTIARDRVLQWLLKQTEKIPGFKSTLIEIAWQDLQSLESKEQRCGPTRREQITQLEKQVKSFTKAIGLVDDPDDLPSVVEQLQAVQKKLVSLRKDEEAANRNGPVVDEYQTTEQIESQLESILLHLFETSPSFADLLRQILPVFEIVPIQTIDNGQIRPRARLVLRLENLRCGSAAEEDGDFVPDIHAELDLFDPPKPLKYLEACRTLKQQNPKWSLKRITAELNSQLASSGADETVNYMSVKRALDVARKMEQEGLQEPYRILTEEPESAPRWKSRKAS